MIELFNDPEDAVAWRAAKLLTKVPNKPYPAQAEDA